MLTCAVCGSENEPQALFCGTCGSALAPVVPEDASPEIIPGHDENRPDDEPSEMAGADADATRIETVPTAGGTAQAAGAPPAATDPEPDPHTIVCSACGTVNDDTRTFCRRCGIELRPPPAPLPVVAGPPPRRLGGVVAALVIAAVLVAIAAIAVILFGGGGGGGTASPTPTNGLATQLATPSAGTPSTGTTSPPEATPTAEPVTLWKARCNRIFLRSGPANDATPLPDDRVLIDHVVTVARTVEGDQYSVDFACTDGPVSSSTWLEIVAIDGVDVKSLYGVDALYSASALFIQVDSD